MCVGVIFSVLWLCGTFYLLNIMIRSSPVCSRKKRTSQQIRHLVLMFLMDIFFKKCWNLIRPDIYRLCTDFYEHIADLKSINYYYITLVPKKSNPEKVSDFRPISLLN